MAEKQYDVEKDKSGNYKPVEVKVGVSKEAAKSTADQLNQHHTWNNQNR